MKIVFAGTTEHASRVLTSLTNRVEIVCVLTREDAPVGRKRILTPSPVAQTADRLGLKVLKANRISEAVNQSLKSFSADLGVVIAYGALLPKSTLDIPKLGWLNIHFSLLPKLRGAAPVQHSLINGDRETGVTIFRLDEGMDSGEVVCVVPTLVQPLENAGELLNRLTNLGISALDQVLSEAGAGTLKGVRQEGEPTFARKLSRSDAKINWHSNARNIENLVRGLNPEPMAWTYLNKQNFRILEAMHLPATGAGSQPGEVRLDGARVLVGCGFDTSLQLVTVQPNGKNVMSALDWYRGTDGSVVFDD